jgi:lipid A 3-O-deacylase
MNYKTVCRACISAGLVLGGFVSIGISPARAVDGMSVVAGQGRNTDMLQIGAQWQWSKRWFQGEHMHVGGFWDAGVAQWRRDEAPGWTDHLTEISFTPTFRLQGNGLQGPYVEAGIGLHLLSETQLGNKRYSTAFQFGEHLGFGWRFGARGAFDLGYRYQHVSNADIKTPNSGADFHQIRLQYWFR